jgi:hypothetical protein
MNSIAVSFGVFAIIFSGALLGMLLRRSLPQEHFGSDAKDAVRLAVGLIVTMTGLVLGMLVSSAKSSYDAQANSVAEMSSDIILLDHLLTLYGPEAKPIRAEALESVEEATDRIWPKVISGQSQLRPRGASKDFYREVELLVPKNEIQAALKSDILSMTSALRKSQWLMFLKLEQTSVSIPLLCVVTSWLVAIFISFGIFAPPNTTVIVTLVVCALAVSAAIFIILEMYSPFTGALRISPAAVHDALRQMATD